MSSSPEPAGTPYISPTDKTVVMLNDRTVMTCTAQFSEEDGLIDGLILEIEEYDRPPIDDEGNRDLAAFYAGSGYRRWELPQQAYYQMMSDLSGMFLMSMDNRAGAWQGLKS